MSLMKTWHKSPWKKHHSNWSLSEVSLPKFYLHQGGEEPNGFDCHVFLEIYEDFLSHACQVVFIIIPWLFFDEQSISWENALEFASMAQQQVLVKNRKKQNQSKTKHQVQGGRIVFSTEKR